VNSAIIQINKYDGLMGAIFDAANKEGVDPKLIVAQITAESGGRTTRIGSSGEAGISQFMYSTASSSPYKEIFGDGLKQCINSASSPETGNCASDPRFDPYKSVRAQAAYLHSSLSSFSNDPSLALAAYNCGASCVSRAVSKSGSSDWSAVSSSGIPASTKTYVTTIMNYYNSITTG
jgi:soluble lytic murein transglycosylase-like protein